jgi:uncharacterized OB-fold protein
VGGFRREGVDEDSFTLAVGASELLESLDPGGDIQGVHLFDAGSGDGSTLLSTALGLSSVPLVVHPDREDALREFLDARAASTDPPSGCLLLFVDALGERDPRGELMRDSAAVAVRLGGPPPRAPLPARGGPASKRTLGGDASALRAALRWLEEGPSRWWVPESHVEASVPPSPARSVDLGGVSEGAYVPRASYLQNLPSRWRFAADRCPACGTLTFPRRGRCRNCSRTEGLATVELPRAGGIVEAVTTVHPGAQPSEFDWSVERRGAYDVALVRLSEGARVTLQVTDCPPGTLHPGESIATVLRRLYPMEGEWRYGRKAVPIALTWAGSGSGLPT